MKTELVKGEKFMTTEELEQGFAVYAYWYNYKRLHLSLGYLPEVEFNKRLALNFVV
jgi:transposase InsO family protein